jgi:type IV pilus assembly protein PilN
MIRINLLPAREARRRVELRRQLQVAVLAVALAIGGGVWGYMAQSSNLEEHQQELAGIQEEVKRLEAVIKEVQKFETRQAMLYKKVGAIEDIKTKQRRPARVLADISRSLPEQMWLVTIKDTGTGIQISGRSFDNVGIAAFMENLERSSSFGNVELIESKAELVQGRQVVAFTVIARGIASKKATS